MEELFKKSESNYKSMDYLKENGFLCTIPHCAYYSCFQLMIFLEGNDFEMKGGYGSHDKLIDFFITEIGREDADSSIAFNNHIVSLKKSRTKADYKNWEVREREVERCIKSAAIVNNILKTTFSHLLQYDK